MYEKCKKACEDTENCQQGIWHSGKFVNLLNDEPPLPEPWTAEDQRPVCYLFAFTAQECQWNGKTVHEHPHFGKFFDSVIGMYPQYPDLSDYDAVFDPGSFSPPMKIRCDIWAQPPCTYIPNECSPKTVDVDHVKGPDFNFKLSKTHEKILIYACNDP